MDYVNFGSTGLRVSRIALGMGLRGQSDEAQAQRIIERALDLGVNLIDCANIYAPMDNKQNAGRSEIILGKAIQGRRDQVVITSKVSGRVGPGPNDRGLSRVHIMREIDRSLARLNTDHIDVYLVHSYDVETPLDETVRALDDIVRDGKARYVGCCNFKAWQVCEALWVADRLHAAPFMCAQNPYSLLNRGIEQEMFGFARAHGLGIMAYSPLAIGLLSGIYAPARPAPSGTHWATGGRDAYESIMQGQAGRVVSTLIDNAHEVGKTPAQLALAWVLSHSEITVAITGGDTLKHLEENVGAVGWKLDDSVRTRMDRVSSSLALNVESLGR